ncbi:putative efflux protein, MATE family [Pseudobutyrivibrio sp. YE44]|uniref:MATE family efflux transporter n=1 Tax=Pseudobutyrivibrio sp. YE44 TaxID=1520802 RepID=UPI00087EC127|nr:MATE family efflux transporter [Pseudobutyrivibrio sp. YE44]SDB34046.1 putative efflux protein, MATE family [Pseudobutyrivibrio sp. YE44]
MKQVDFEHGRTLTNIFKTAIPMLVAQILNLLYNIVDRIYIARIPKIGTVALGAVGLCFPIVILITAFTNMYGSGGAPLFSIARGRGDREEAQGIQNTSFFLIIVTAIVLIIFGEIFGRPVLSVFGASDAAMVYALPYLRIYLLGTIFSMVATGMNPFITAQGFSTVGMTTVIVGAAANILLDPLFIFALHMGVQGAAVATIISQSFSAAYVIRFLFGKKCEFQLKLLSVEEIKTCGFRATKIIALGTAGFMTYFTNAVVQISCNSVLAHVGGDVYVSVMTIVNSARQMLETPIIAISEGTSPIISYNYGAYKFDKIKKSIVIMFTLEMAYTICMWLIIRFAPETIIAIFTNDKTILKDAVPAFNLYFSTFVFMVFQYVGQIVFKSLGRKGHAIFFSLFRKVVIVVPLTYMLPYLFNMGINGVFAAEPISNVVGGMACFITMIYVVNKIFKTEGKNAITF